MGRASLSGSYQPVRRKLGEPPRCVLTVALFVRALQRGLTTAKKRRR